MAYSARETTRDIASQTRRAADGLMDQARRHPISTALIGLGAAWLLTSRSRSSNRYYDRGSARWEDDWTDDSGGYGLLDRLRDNAIPAALCGVGLTWLATSEAGAGQRQGLYEESWDDGSSSGESSTISDAAQRVTETAQQYASETSEAVRRTTRRAQSQLQRMIDENPLMVGAGAFVIGAAFGLSLPETEREKQLMGEMRDTVVERAQELARDAASTVQQVTGNAADEAVKRVIGGDQA